MTNREINKKIQETILNSAIDVNEIIRYVKNECKMVSLTPQTLGMLFEVYAGVNYDKNDLTSCFSREISIVELRNIHPGFESTNGCHRARSDSCYLGKRYKIRRIKKGGKVVAIQLDGSNHNSIKKHRSIRKDIRDKILTQKCVVLDIASNIEVDHKNGRYDELSNIDLNDQKTSDFQPLTKAVNDAKRQHCKECIRDGKRYDAHRLGYKEGRNAADKNTVSRSGCY